jgi:hypothetical protein
MSTPPTPTDEANANEGNGSSIMNEQQPQPQSVVQVPLEEAVAPTASDDDVLITMRNDPESTNASTNANAEVPSPPQAQDLNESAQSLGAIEESAAAHDALVSTDSNISMQGGRLWQAAAQEAERRGRTMDSTGAVLPASASQEQEMEGNGSPRRSGPTGPGSRFAETFMERTRSRADPNALFADPKAKDTPGGTLHYFLCCAVLFCCCELYYHYSVVYDIIFPPSDESNRLTLLIYSRFISLLIFSYHTPYLQAHNK